MLVDLPPGNSPKVGSFFMETTSSIVDVRLSPPTLLGGNKVSVSQIRDTIKLSPSSWVGFKDGLIQVDNARYNPKYYLLIPSNETQRKVIEKAVKTLFPVVSKTKDTPKKVSTNHTVDYELKQLDTLTSLCKKIASWNNHKEKAKTTKDEDKFILLGRQLTKERKQIDEYLRQLKEDKSFSISDNHFQYTGEFVTASKLIPEGGF
jgi:predicted MPP superfamily phosphohydrolase